MAKAKIEVGDWLVFKPMRVAFKLDDDVTVEFLGKRFTIPADSDQIDKVIKDKSGHRGALFDTAD